MMYCSQCGFEVNSGMRFCPNCGSAIHAEIKGHVKETDGASTDGTDYDSVYRVILLNLGRCTRSKARECLTEYINYSVFDANTIMNSLPAEIACNLSLTQAKALAKVLTNCGMQVAVCDEDAYVDMNSAAGTVETTNDNGNIWTGILGVLATLGIVNQVKQIRRWNRPYVRRHIYGYQPYRPTPPRTMGKPIPPKPAMRGSIPKPPMSGFGTGSSRSPRGGRPGGFGTGHGAGGPGGRGPHGR